jgi:hypothetical protein
LQKNREECGRKRALKKRGKRLKPGKLFNIEKAIYYCLKKVTAMKGTILLIALAVILFASAAAAENVTEVKIESIPVIVKAGTRLDFSFLVGNREGEACNAQIRYWVGSLDPKPSQGSDTVYLGEGEIMKGSASVLVPSSMGGVQDFYLELVCNETVVVANKTIEVRASVPTMPQFSTLDIEASAESEQLEFSYEIKSNEEETIAVQVEEQLTKDNNVVWTNTQNIAVTGSTQIKGFGPLLPPGNYQLAVKAIHGNETARMVREFTVSPVPPPLFPGAVTTGLIVLLLAIIILGGIATARFFSKRDQSLFQRILPSLARGGTAVKHRICNVESESSGVLEELELSQMIDDAGFKGKKRQKAILYASRTPIEQLVRSCVVTYKNGKTKCETTVTATVQNNSNRNWNNLVMLVRVPLFLKKNTSSFEADCESEAIEGTTILKFKLPKVGAMQSASLSYKSGKIISQAEANSVPLPAVIRYRRGKPLVVTQVKIEKQVETAKVEKKKKAAKILKKKQRKGRKKAGD